VNEGVYINRSKSDFACFRALVRLQLQENTELLVQFRDNIFAILNG
jgi:hypothetical protein